VTLNTVTSKKSKGDISAYATPAQSPRAVATGGSLALPSHISVFGDGQPEEEVIANPRGGGVRLPSHISAFGDGDEDDLAFAVKGLKGTAHLHPAADNTNCGGHPDHIGAGAVPLSLPSCMRCLGWFCCPS
jgi:hypothetical protein